MKRLMDAEQAGQLLNVTPRWLLRHARVGDVPHHRLGRHVRFAEDELDRWLEDRRRRTPGVRRPGGAPK